MAAAPPRRLAPTSPSALPWLPAGETEAGYDLEYRTRAETLLAVDEQIDTVVRALEDIGQLDNT